MMLMRVANHQLHAREGSDFVWSALSVASGDYDAGVGILPADSTDCGAGVLICRGRHGASVQDDNGGVSGARSANQSLLFELAFESGAVGLGGATAEVFYKESSHTLW